MQHIKLIIIAAFIAAFVIAPFARAAVKIHRDILFVNYRTLDLTPEFCKGVRAGAQIALLDNDPRGWQNIFAMFETGDEAKKLQDACEKEREARE